MDRKNNVGIWMDQFNAHLIDIDTEINNCSIASKFRCNGKDEVLNMSKGFMHNQKQQMQEAYYKEIANEILKYDDVLFFGSKSAKVELRNYLIKDAQIKKVKIDLESEDSMAASRLDTFITKHFKNR
ncbi:MAG: hypothetical protein ACJASQ_001228 [Crocinitomicaceae bacterium]|jgi:hypothetical protein